MSFKYPCGCRLDNRGTFEPCATLALKRRRAKDRAMSNVPRRLRKLEDVQGRANAAAQRVEDEHLSAQSLELPQGKVR